MTSTDLSFQTKMVASHDFAFKKGEEEDCNSSRSSNSSMTNNQQTESDDEPQNNCNLERPHENHTREAENLKSSSYAENGFYNHEKDKRANRHVAFSDLAQNAHAREQRLSKSENGDFVELQRMGADLNRSSSPSLFLCLPFHMQLYVLSFLDDASYRQVEQVNHTMRSLLTNLDDPSTALLWKHACHSIWPWLPDVDFSKFDEATIHGDDTGDARHETIRFVDSLHLPTSMETVSIDPTKVNYGLLLSLATQTKPTQIDPATLRPTRYSRNQRIHRPRTNATPHFQIGQVNNVDNINIISFDGAVGRGDRCIRTEKPFHRPKRLTESEISVVLASKAATEASYRALSAKKPDAHKDHHDSHHHHRHHGAMNRIVKVLTYPIRHSPIQKLHGHHTSTTPHVPHDDIEFIWKPFVAPYATTSKMKAPKHSRAKPRVIKEMQLMPRLVSYYEITVLPSPNRQPRPPPAMFVNNEEEQRGFRPGVTNYTSECIVVGLALDEFPLTGRMPGWDDVSYGYHGDDGKVYHGLGGDPENPRHDREFGPKYGVNDTVGCGIDYHRRAIFFTLNGNFLGYGFEHLTVDFLAEHDLYPVVGIDTSCTVRCNFGANVDYPFQFDLTSYILMNQKEVLLQTLMPTVTKFQQTSTSSSGQEHNAKSNDSKSENANNDFKSEHIGL